MKSKLETRLRQMEKKLRLNDQEPKIVVAPIGCTEDDLEQLRKQHPEGTKFLIVRSVGKKG
ncbi:MAG: hypothetical protein KAI25_02620 [Hyphomicrobiaceae bacterium]|nr:hypothetical protein [Hyphomicrobiaceae bacterium]